MTGNLFLEMLYYFKKNEMRWQVSTSALTILLSGIEQDLLSKQGGFFSEFYYVCAGWNFSFITWKFASRMENCSEIVERECYFNRYLKEYVYCIAMGYLEENTSIFFLSNVSSLTLNFCFHGKYIGKTQDKYFVKYKSRNQEKRKTLSRFYAGPQRGRKIQWGQM